NNLLLILLGASTTSTADSIAYLGTLKGMIAMHMQQFTLDSQQPFHLRTCVELINRMICEDNLRQQFALSMLLLNPAKDMLSYISCGFDALLHMPEGHAKPRKLISDNPLLGAFRNAEFSEISDNWNESDILI